MSLQPRIFVNYYLCFFNDLGVFLIQWLNRESEWKIEAVTIAMSLSHSLYTMYCFVFHNKYIFYWWRTRCVPIISWTVNFGVTANFVTLKCFMYLSLHLYISFCFPWCHCSNVHIFFKKNYSEWSAPPIS